MLRVGLLGAGYLGRIHIGLLKGIPDISFVGFYDVDAENATNIAKEFQVNSFSSFDDLLASSDALVIVTPTQTHFEMARKCLEAGKHIFIEKPATATIEEGESLIQLASATNLKVQIGHVERFNPALQAIYNDLEGVKRIYCHRLAPFTPRGADVSVVFDVMIHDIEIVLSLVKSPVTGIVANGRKIQSSTYDLANAGVTFENGVVANFSASRMAERKYRLTEFVMEGSIYRVDYLNKQTCKFTAANGDNAQLAELYLKNESLLNKETIAIREFNAIEQELISFTDSIVNNKKVVVSLHDGVGAMQLASAIEAQMND